MISLVFSDTVDCGISHSTFSPQGDSTNWITFVPIMLLVTRPPLIILRKGFRPQLEGLPTSHTPRRMGLHQLRYGQMYDIHVRQMEHVVPIFLCHHHLMNDLFDVLIGRFNCTFQVMLTYYHILISSGDYYLLIFWSLLVDVRCWMPVTVRNRWSFNVLIKNAKDTERKGQKGHFRGEVTSLPGRAAMTPNAIFCYK